MLSNVANRRELNNIVSVPRDYLASIYHQTAVIDWAYLEAAHIPVSIDFKLCSFLTTDPGGFLHMVQMFLPILPLLSSVF